MAKKKKKSKKKAKHDPQTEAPASVANEHTETDPPPTMKRKEYVGEMRRLHGELVAMQEWVKSPGPRSASSLRVVTRPARAGDQAITERISPRVFRIVALTAPNEREQSQCTFTLHAAFTSGR